MYDDDEAALQERARRDSNTTVSSHGRSRDRRRGRGERDRSASPGRDDHDMRRRTPPPRYRRNDPNPVPKANLGKELFPAKSESNRQVAAGLKKELFPKKAGGTAKELFPAKAAGTVNGNGVLRDDPADATADLFRSRMPVPFVDGANEGEFPLRSDGVPRRRDPANGIAVKGLGSRNGVRQNPDDGGFAVRGAAADLGFAIRGAAADAQRTRDVADKKFKELFPERLENRGKELFIKGRASASRAKADTFF